MSFMGYFRNVGRAILGRSPSAATVSDGRLETSGGRTGFLGARRDRMTQDWNPANLSATSIHRQDARMLHARSRDLFRNNPFAIAARNAYVANVIGPGIHPRPRLTGVVGEEAAAA